MRNYPFSLALASAVLVLMLLIVSCSLPGYTPSDPAAQYQATIQAAAVQTMGAPTMGAPNAVTPDVVATINALATANQTTAGAGPTGATQAALDTQAAAAAQGAAFTQAAAITQMVAGTQAAAQATGASFSGQATSLALTAQANQQAQAFQATAWAATTTAAAFPPVPPPQAAGRLRFAPGATSTRIEGSLAAGGLASYLLEAGANQTLLASVYSPGNDVYLGVTTPDGVPLLRPAADQTDFTGQLPLAGDYRLTVAASNQAANYTLQVIIPARIQFAPGAVSASLPGYLPGGQVNFYQAWARAGQRMTVRILSPNNDVFLTIYGLQDGSPLVRSVMGQTEWSDVLNLSQDYMIQAVSTGGNTNYTIEITIQ